MELRAPALHNHSGRGKFATQEKEKGKTGWFSAELQARTRFAFF